MALSNFITDAALKDAVKAALGVAASDTLPAFWDTQIANGNRQATLDIYERLGQIGFTVSQISNWDLGPDYATNQGVFWTLTYAAGLGNYAGPKHEHLDRREDLSNKSALIIDGEFVGVTPGESPVGGISFGRTNSAAAATAQFAWFNAGNCGPVPCGYGQDTLTSCCGS